MDKILGKVRRGKTLGVEEVIYSEEIMEVWRENKVYRLDLYTYPSNSLEDIFFIVVTLPDKDPRVLIDPSTNKVFAEELMVLWNDYSLLFNNEITVTIHSFFEASYREQDISLSNAIKSSVRRLNDPIGSDFKGLRRLKKPSAKPCPKCGSKLLRLKGFEGFFLGCSGFKEGCSFTATEHNAEAVEQ